MVRRWVCGVVVVAVILGSLGWSAPAMANQPSDYYVTEFLKGEFASLIGGISVGGAGVLLGFLVPDDCRVQKALCIPIFAATGVLGGLLGLTLGASLGVTLAGQATGVEGNVVAAYVGSFLGTIASFFTIHDLRLFTPTLLLAPAALAVIGYNIGATMKDTGQPALLPWSLDLPVLSLEF